MIIQNTCTPESMFSGERFTVTYRVFGSEKEARAKAEDICIEQTVEFPADEVPEGVIRDHVFGRIERFARLDCESFMAVISYAIVITARELTRLPNVMPVLHTRKIESDIFDFRGIMSCHDQT